MSRRVFAGSGLCAAGWVLLLAASAGAQSSGDQVTAEALFDDGRKLMSAGKYAEACPKLEASHRFDPALGTLLYLADCLEKSGKTATAWAKFREATAIAKKSGDKREQVARDRAAALDGVLTRMNITIATNARVPGLTVKRDGVALDEALWGTAVPVDPGQHSVEATAPGKKAFSASLEVVGSGKTVAVEIPALADGDHAAAVASAPAAASAPPVAASSAPAPAPAPAAKDGGSQRTMAVVAGSVGVVALGVGAFFGLRTMSKWSDSKGHCDGSGCDPEGVTLASDAHSAGNVSTIAFAIGAIGVGGAAVLWFTAPKASDSGSIPPRRPTLRAAPAVSPSGASMLLTGSF
jgi:hypothetical protein